MPRSDRGNPHDEQRVKQAALALRAGRSAEAVRLLEPVLASGRATPSTRLLMGLALEAAGDLASAATWIERAARAPDAVALFHLGRVQARVNRLVEAESNLQRSLELSPRAADTHDLLGRVRLARGAVEAAEQNFRRALELRPKHAPTMVNLGDARRQAGDPVNSEQWYRRALAADPGNLAALNNLSILLVEVDRASEALEALERLTASHQRFVPGWINRAEVLSRLDRPEAALEVLESARARFPEATELEARRFKLLAAAQRFEEANALLAGHDGASSTLARLLLADRPASRVPDAVAPVLDARGAWLEQRFERFRQADWTDYEGTRRRMLSLVREGLEGGVAIVAPNNLLYLSPDDLALETRLAGAYASHVERALAGSAEPAFTHARSGRGRITLGYLSPDFRDHAVAHVARDLIKGHDRDRFRVIGYSLERRGEDAWQREFREIFDDFVDLSEDSNQGAAERIHDDQVDILVDLYGWGPRERPEILARRPAPIQVGHLGYPSTTGAPWIDYTLAGGDALPDRLARHYSESVVTLPVTHLVTAGFPEAGEAPDRDSLGLPPDSLVFSSFHRAEKFTPQLFDVWARLLEATPDSILWLLGDRPETQYRLRGELEHRGVHPDRVIFAPRVPLAGHVARQRHADIALDTLLYSGFNTSAIALWCGVPLVTHPGTSLTKRAIPSVLQASGAGDLVATDAAGYERIAIRLAADPAWRSEMARRVSSPGNALFDSCGNLRHVERAFEIMWERHLAGEGPAPFRVKAD